MQKITDLKELFSTFLEFLFSHCCYMEKYWCSNNHIQRVYIFIVGKSGKTGFRCILKVGYLKKIQPSAFILVSLHGRFLGITLEKCVFFIGTQFVILKSEISNVCKLSVYNWFLCRYLSKCCINIGTCSSLTLMHGCFPSSMCECGSVTGQQKTLGKWWVRIVVMQQYIPWKLT